MRIRVRGKILFVDETFSPALQEKPWPGEVFTPALAERIAQVRERKLRQRVRRAIQTAFPVGDPELLREVEAHLRGLSLENVGGANGGLGLVTPSRIPANKQVHGLNFPEMYETTRGTVGGKPGVFEDAQSMGVKVLRQFASTDFHWAFISSFNSASSSSSASRAVPLPIPLATANIADMETAVTDYHGLIARYVDLFRLAHTHGLKLVCTLLFPPEAGEKISIGTLSSVSQINIKDSTGAYLKNFDGYKWDPYWLDYSDLQNWHLMPWAEDHNETSPPPYLSISLPRYQFPSCTTSDDSSFHYNTFDPTSKYKQQYMGKLGEFVGHILTNVQAVIGTEFDLKDVIHAFEVANEVSGKMNVTSTAYGKYRDIAGNFALSPGQAMHATGRFWGQTHFWTAYGLRLGLKGTSLFETPIWAPGVLSYEEDGVGTYFSYDVRIIDFLKGFLHGLGEELLTVKSDVNGLNLLKNLFGPILYGFNLEDLPLSKFVSGVDYHWYHKSSGRPIAYLCKELPEIQNLPQSITEDDLEDDESTRMLIEVLSWQVTNFESGSGTKDFGFIIPDTSASGYDHASAVLSERAFQIGQARDLLRRRLGAFCGGAAISGIHTWMAGTNTSSPFVTHGLRVDFQPTSSGPELCLQRYAWFTYQDTVEEINGAKDVSLLYPVSQSATRADLTAALSSPSTKSWLTIFHVRKAMEDVYYFISNPLPKSGFIDSADIFLFYNDYPSGTYIANWTDKTILNGLSFPGQLPRSTAYPTSYSHALDALSPIYPWAGGGLYYGYQLFTMLRADGPLRITVPFSRVPNLVTLWVV